MNKMINKNKTLGILYIIGSAFSFAVMGLFIRLSGDLPVFEKVFFRNAITTILSLAIILTSKNKINKIEKSNLKGLIIRSTAGTLGILLHFYALDNMNIADASILNKLSPFFAMIVSFIILKEKAFKSDWIITFFAFVGAIFVVKPSLDFGQLPAFCGVLGGLCAGIAYTYVRKLSKEGVSSVMIVFFFSLFSTIFTFVLFIVSYEPMSSIQLLYLILAGLMATSGQICITRAYGYAPAKELGSFDYTQVVFAAIIGWVFLNQLPDMYSIIGYVIIISMAILKWKYDSLRTS